MKSSAMTVALVGSSTIHGKGQAYDLIADLSARPANAGLRFLNFGRGGDLAFNTLQRLPEVIKARPTKVVVLVGGDDVLFSTFPKLRRFLVVTKRPPREPSPEWFEECMREILRRLRADTAAEVALCSLGPIGEDLGSSGPCQQKLNQLVANYSAIVRRICQEEAAAYLPFFERMRDQMMASPGRALTRFALLPMYLDAFRTLVLHEDLDQLGERHGWRLHTDGIHLNRRGGKILVDLIQGFLGT